MAALLKPVQAMLLTVNEDQQVLRSQFDPAARRHGLWVPHRSPLRFERVFHKPTSREIATVKRRGSITVEEQELAMSVLLRHPATVPTLFSRAVEVDRAAAPFAARWGGQRIPTAIMAALQAAAPMRNATLGASACSMLVAIEITLVPMPMVKAAVSLFGTALTR